MPVRTHPGIRKRILLAFILLTLLPAAAITWLGLRAVDKVIEQRLVRERVTNTARVLSTTPLVFNAGLMAKLKEMFGADQHVAAELRPDAIGEEMVSTLAAEELKQLQAQLQDRGTAPRAVMIGGRTFVLGTAEVRDAAGHNRTLYLLVDQRVVDEARRDAVRPILLGAIPVLVGVIAIAAYISRTITQPIRRLSAQMEQQFPATDGSLSIQDVNLDAPRELADLASTFNRMLGRLRETQQRLIESERLAAIGKLAASVAHEVRNPLAGIRMNLQLLQQHLARAGTSDESLNIAINEVERLDSIVQEMLVLGRSGTPRREPADLRAIASDVLALLSRRLEHGGVTASVEGEAIEASVDAAQIKQVMLNLVINALDAMPRGGRVTLRVIHRDGAARVEIDDTGSGLALPAGQDPFAWFSTSKSAGSGIGLAVCRQIIEAHGGKIGLERVDGGTRAWFEV